MKQLTLFLSGYAANILMLDVSPPPDPNQISLSYLVVSGIMTLVTQVTILVVTAWVERNKQKKSANDEKV